MLIRFSFPCRMTVLTRVGYFSWPFTFPQTTPSNRQRWDCMCLRRCMCCMYAQKQKKHAVYSSIRCVSLLMVQHCQISIFLCTLSLLNEDDFCVRNHIWPKFSPPDFVKCSHPPPPLSVSLSPPPSRSLARSRLPQESTTQISTATAASASTSCDHSGLLLSPSPKVRTAVDHTFWLSTRALTYNMQNDRDWVAISFTPTTKAVEAMVYLHTLL